MSGGFLGLLGGGGNSAYQEQADSSLRKKLDLAGQYGGYADNALGDYNVHHDRSNQLLDHELDYLGQTQGTDQQQNALVARHGPTTRAYLQTQSHLQSLLARNGLDTASSSGPSSVLGGGLAYNEAQRLNGTIGAQDQAQQYYDQLNQQHQLQALQLADNAQQQDWQQGMGAMGSETGLYDSVYGDQQHLAEAEAAQNNSLTSGILGLLGGPIGQGIGGAIAGGGLFGSKKKKPA